MDVQNNLRLINYLNDSHFLLFKNKNEYYIANNGYQKLYKIFMINKNEFKLEKFEENKNAKDLINSDEINKIMDQLKILEKENKKLNKIISKFPFILKENEYILVLIIKTFDEKVIFSSICKNTDKFIKVEDEFYKEYPEYREYKGYFKIYNKLIDKYKTIEDNKLKNNSVIIFEKN